MVFFAAGKITNLGVLRVLGGENQNKGQDGPTKDGAPGRS